MGKVSLILEAREDEILFIDARNLGEMIDRRHRELKDEDIKKIAGNLSQL